MIQIFDPQRDRHLRRADLRDVVPGHASNANWIDLQAPSTEEIDAIGKRFGFHHLAIEDAHKRRQRPKVETYPNHLFFVIYAFSTNDASRDLVSHEIALFATQEVVVTVHADDIDALKVAEHRWAGHCGEESGATAGMLVYTISDAIIDGYFPVMDMIADEVDAVQERMFDSAALGDLEEIFILKRSLIDLRRYVAPTRDVFNALTRREVAAFRDESHIFYQDLYDHVIRVTEAIDAHRDVLASAVDIYVSLQSNNLNQTVRTLTSASIVLMSMTLIAGIYGMNFERMPELSWRFGYPAALLGMVGVGVLLTWLFRRLRWW